MATSILKMTIQFRRDTTANWEANKHVVPAAGEPCYDLDLKTLKIGDGVTAYENLPSIGGIEVDGTSLVFEDGVLKLLGFDAAEIGAQPRKKSDGTIEWVVPSTETVDGLKSAVAGLQTDVTGLQTGASTMLSRIETLEDKMDGTGEGSVDAKIDAKIEAFATSLTDDGKVNTLMELINYVESHGEEAADMASDIKSLQELVGSTPVSDQIMAIVNASGHMDEEKANAVFDHVKYEISSKPEGTLVDYRDKEIRVMVPADTQFELQNSGEGSDANAYYIGFKAYAPDGAVNFKEDLAATIADDTMYTFEGEFAGVDKYGRKYSIVWLPVAQYADGAWTYYGSMSSTSKYIGWYYSVEWYDADGGKIASDTIRINLSNEACHSAIEPYYLAGALSGVSVDGTLLDVVDGVANIPLGAGLKASDEISIAEDGTLGVGAVGVSKLVNEDGVTLVLDGGAAV